SSLAPCHGTPPRRPGLSSGTFPASRACTKTPSDVLCLPILSLAERLRRSFSVEKTFFLEFMPDLVRRSRGQVLHAFELRLGQPRQMPDEVHQAPARFLTGRAARSPARHAGEANTVLEDVEELAIGQLLSSGKAHVRRFR